MIFSWYQNEFSVSIGLKAGAASGLKLGDLGGKLVLESAGVAAEVGLSLQLVQPQVSTLFEPQQPEPAPARVQPPENDQAVGQLFERRPSETIPRLEVEPSCLDFGVLSSSDGPVSRAIKVIHHSGDACTLTPLALMPGLQALPEKLYCQPGQQYRIEVTLKIHPFHPKGANSDSRGIRLDSDRQLSIPVAIRFEVV